MPRIAPVTAPTGPAKELLDAVQKKLGKTPNMMRALANSPAALKGYLELAGAVGGGLLNAKVREQIALAVAEVNGCDYCASAHSALGKMAGLAPTDIEAARRASASDTKTAAILRFASRLVESKGRASDADLSAVRAAGVNDAEVTEIVANVALNVFTNYFNHVADPEIDFPAVKTAGCAC